VTACRGEAVDEIESHQNKEQQQQPETPLTRAGSWNS
jgi:hypothetical protein